MRPPLLRCLAALLVVLALASGACARHDGRASVTIYTSIYEHVIAELDPVLREEFPDVRIRWFQRGSEDVAARLNSEIAAGRVGKRLAPRGQSARDFVEHLRTQEVPVCRCPACRWG